MSRSARRTYPMVGPHAAGEAVFYCPTALLLPIPKVPGLTLGGLIIKHGLLPKDVAPENMIGFDGAGHEQWTFQWAPSAGGGAFHIEHPLNGGGIPKCRACGQRLVFVYGDHPDHSPE